jgi:HSP20 family protein
MVNDGPSEAELLEARTMASMMRSSDQPVLSLREAMDRLFEQSFTPFSRGLSGDGGFQHSPTNLWEDANHYYLHLLVPGADLSSVDITATNGALIVSGKMLSPKPADAKAIYQEWGDLQFRRQFQLPAGFDADKCEATYKDGVLTVTVPKPERIKPKSIKVQVAS